jgi:peptidoglycan/LPS O-acetylase OafA/YrhL
MVVVAVLQRLPHVPQILLPMQYGFLFALFALGLMHWQPRALVNPVIGWIGKVSYSGYLIHLGLIAAVPIPHATYREALAIVISATVALSTVTYFLVEEPFNRLGRRLVRVWLSRAAPRTISDASEIKPSAASTR